MAVNIDPKATVGGVPILQVRDFLKRYGAEGFMAKDLRERFGEAVAAHLLRVVVSEGYVERAEIYGEWRYGNTAKGGQLARASAARPVSRAKAEQALTEFLGRCDDVRTRPEFLFTVEEAILFGSMLTDKPKVSDVDVAIALRPKEKDAARLAALVHEQVRHARDEGVRFSNLLEMHHYPWSRVERFLKGRSRIVQLTRADDEILGHADKKVIYSDPG